MVVSTVTWQNKHPLKVRSSARGPLVFHQKCQPIINLLIVGADLCRLHSTRLFPVFGDMGSVGESLCYWRQTTLSCLATALRVKAPSNELACAFLQCEHSRSELISWEGIRIRDAVRGCGFLRTGSDTVTEEITFTEDFSY